MTFWGSTATDALVASVDVGEVEIGPNSGTLVCARSVARTVPGELTTSIVTMRTRTIPADVVKWRSYLFSPPIRVPDKKLTITQMIDLTRLIPANSYSRFKSQSSAVASGPHSHH